MARLNPWRRPLFCLALCLFANAATAVTTYRGSANYLTVWSTNIRFPTFSKEFSEGAGTIRVGGAKQLFLDSDSQSVGLRLTREYIRPNGSGLGFSISAWRGSFADEAFLYDREGINRFIAEYRNPKHTYLFADLHFALVPWESGSRALGIYSLFSLVGDREEYRIERYALRGTDPTRRDLSEAERSRSDLRFGFGFGTRLHLAKRAALWLEKRWIVGERFGVGQTLGEGGLFEGGRQKTLYVPFNSFGFSLAF